MELRFSCTRYLFSWSHKGDQELLCVLSLRFVCKRCVKSYHALNALLHVTKTLLVVRATTSHVNLNSMHSQSLLEVSDGLDDTLEGLSHICEVGNASANDENLVKEHRVRFFHRGCSDE